MLYNVLVMLPGYEITIWNLLMALTGHF